MFTKAVYQKEPMTSFSFLTTLSLPITHSHTQTHSPKLKAGQQRKSRPCGPVTHSVSLILRRLVFKFPELKCGKFYGQIGKIPAVVVVSLNQIQMCFNIATNNFN